MLKKRLLHLQCCTSTRYLKYQVNLVLKMCRFWSLIGNETKCKLPRRTTLEAMPPLYPLLHPGDLVLAQPRRVYAILAFCGFVGELSPVRRPITLRMK